MVRAGEGGYLAADFVEKGCVAVGFDGVGDFTPLRDLDAIKGALRRRYPDRTPVQIVVAASVANKFRSLIKVGDAVVTYNPETRLYHLGRISGEYEFLPGLVPDYDHVRRVLWERSISRDALSVASRNSLGSTITIFEPGDAVLNEFLATSSSEGAPPDRPSNPADDREEVTRIFEDQLSRSREFIKDRINRLDPHQMEHLAAALLRALGFKARVTPVGSDRGRDVIASPDGLGLQSPRIFCEVKHRKGQIGAPEVRSFAASLRHDDRGLYLSTGGFSKEAKYEAERASVPISLIDLDDLAKLVIEHYERFDTPGRALIPLDRFYWPIA